MAATRFYFDNGSTVADATPTPNAAWDVTASYVTRRLYLVGELGVTPAGSDSSLTETSTSVVNRLRRQHVSHTQVVVGHTISGTFSMVFRGLESNTGADAFLQVIAYVIDATGSTVRGVLYSGQTQTTVSSTTGDPNQEWPTGTAETRILVNIPVTPVVAQAGDRIVVEVGSRHTNTVSTSYGTTFSLNALAAGTDLPLTAGTAPSDRPWIEFSDDIFTTGTTVAATTATASASMPAPSGPTIPVEEQARETNTLPLSVRIGTRHISSEVAGLRFRKEAIGGVRNIALRLARPLDRFDTDLQAYSRVYIYDARNAETIAEGRLSDFGRSADAAAGQQWDMIAFGPVQHASDITLPIVYVDQSLERWNLADYKSVEMANSALSEDTNAGEVGMKHKPSHGQTVATTFVSAATYYAIGEAGQKLGGVITAWRAGLADTDYRATISTGVLTVGTETNAYDAAFATGTTNKTVVAVTDFTNGDDFVSLNMLRQTTTTTADPTHWLRWKSLMVRAMLKDQVGADITTGYTTAYVLAAQVVKDLLGRALPQFDGTNATIAGGATHQIDQLAYVDGVTPAQVLDDLMILEPAYYWTTTPSDPTTGLYGFVWKVWPTAVRYEIALDDGGSFPQSSQELWNQVVVRWRGPAGAIHQTLRTGTCAVLDAAGVTRRTMIDLGDEASSLANAQRAGDNFLAAHSVPANAGTLNVSRPIRDLTTGALVQPFEIEPGELIRVRGVESYPDALNASSNDGLTVFRIWSMEYDSDSNSATLELDTYSRTTANAIARLTTRRNRKR